MLEDIARRFDVLGDPARPRIVRSAGAGELHGQGNRRGGDVVGYASRHFGRLLLHHRNPADHPRLVVAVVSYLE
jgi:hypothetical protein